MNFQRTTSDNSDFQYLVALLDEDLKIRDGNDHIFYAQFNKIENIKNAIVCYINGNPIGCGGFKRYDQAKVEIKRMFVLSEHRGRGVGEKILNELEKWASELNYSGCILETGKKQPEAIQLYQKSGYQVIKNYGQYAGIENSVCMEKSLEDLR
ncbi:MAG: GNAT family N-acetyltransferase [Chitinophagales bacterium]